MRQSRFRTSSEELMFVDDRPAYPSCCFLRATMMGVLDRDAFETAISLTLRRHPLLRATVTRHSHRLAWCFVENPTPQINWVTSRGDLAEAFTDGIDLTAEIGIRFRVFVEGSKTEVLIQFHHSACDGRGILRFLDDLLISYAHAITRGDGDLEHSGAPFSMPASGQRPAPTFRRVIPFLIDGFRHGWSVVRRVPSPLLAHGAAPNESPLGYTYPAVARETFSRGTTASFFGVARALGVTGNDLLLTSAFLAINDWRDAFGGDHDEWIRILSPIDLRTKSERTHPAANIVSGFFLDRRGADSRDPWALLRGVHQEMMRNKRKEFGRMFQLATNLCRHFPGGLRKQVLAKKCLLSLVFTNLGRVLEDSTLPRRDERIVAGNVTLESVEVLPPLRPYVCASFSATTYGGELALAVHYDGRFVTRDQANDLLGCLLKRLRSWPAIRSDVATHSANAESSFAR